MAWRFAPECDLTLCYRKWLDALPQNVTPRTLLDALPQNVTWRFAPECDPQNVTWRFAPECDSQDMTLCPRMWLPERDLTLCPRMWLTERDLTLCPRMRLPERDLRLCPGMWFDTVSQNVTTLSARKQQALLVLFMPSAWMVNPALCACFQLLAVCLIDGVLFQKQISFYRTRSKHIKGPKERYLLGLDKTSKFSE